MKMWERYRELAETHETRLEHVGRIVGNLVRRMDSDDLPETGEIVDSIFSIHQITQRYVPKEDRYERGGDIEVAIPDEIRTRILQGRQAVDDEQGSREPQS